MKRFTSFNIIFLTLLFIVGLCFSTSILADGGANHRKEQPGPILLGTTGGNINDISLLYCCGGTLGSLVQKSGTQYILSNNHVLARTNKAPIGEDIIHPGLIDQNPVCGKDNNDIVADLTALKTISFKTGTTNTIDAAIAQIRTGAVDTVDTTGSILDIGQVSTSTVTPNIWMAVKKSGRTTGLTTGTITAINVTADIYYSKQCGIGSQKARFVNQIMIGPGGFSKGGDSGSLIVENVACSDASPARPRAVGLLFAGSSSVTIANTIGNVLSAFGVSMVGGCSSSGKIEEKSLFRRMIAWLFPAARAEQELPVNPTAVAAASQAKNRHENALLDIPGVVGAGVGLSGVAQGQVVIEVYVKELSEGLIRTIPKRLDGVSVEIVETGEIVAF